MNDGNHKFINNTLKKNFTIIATKIFHIKTISLKAKGLYCQMVSLPSNWRFSESGLESLSTDGLSSVKSAIKELIDSGLLTREQIKVNGRFSHSIYTLNLPSEFDKILSSEITSSENQTTENQMVYKEENNKKNNNKKISSKEEITSEDVVDKISKIHEILNKTAKVGKKDVVTMLLKDNLYNKKHKTRQEFDQLCGMITKELAEHVDGMGIQPFSAKLSDDPKIKKIRRLLVDFIIFKFSTYVSGDTDGKFRRMRAKNIAEKLADYRWKDRSDLGFFDVVDNFFKFIFKQQDANFVDSLSKLNARTGKFITSDLTKYVEKQRYLEDMEITENEEDKYYSGGLFDDVEAPEKKENDGGNLISEAKAYAKENGVTWIEAIAIISKQKTEKKEPTEFEIKKAEFQSLMNQVVK